MKIRNALFVLLSLLLVISFNILRSPGVEAARSSADQSSADQKSARVDPAELKSLLDPLFAEEMEKEHLPGAVFALVKDGKVVFSSGYGYADVEKKTPVTADKTSSAAPRRRFPSPVLMTRSL